MPHPEEISELLDMIVGNLANAGIPYWLDYGTLLGAVREGGFITGDSDGDISIFEEDSQRARELLGEHIAGIGFEGSGMQVYLSDDSDTHIDIFFWYLDDDMRRRRWYLPDVDYNKGKDFPASWVSELSQVEFEGKLYSAPGNPEQMCEHRYGSTWMVPMSRIEFYATYNHNR